MKKHLFLFALLCIAIIPLSKAQILCIYCYDQNDSISDNVTNLIQNGSFEVSTCTPNSNGNSWCPVSVNYNCDLANWTCVGGGTQTYSQLFNNAWTTVPDGAVAAYFGNAFCNPCSQTVDDTSCFVRNGCEITGIPAGFPENDPVSYGGNAGLSLTQTVNGLTVGNTYVLEFWSGGEDFGVFVNPGMFGLDIGFGYTYLETVPTDFGDIGMRHIVIFNATATSHPITFTNWGHICGSCSELTLDNVRLYPVADLDPSVNPCVPINNFSVNAVGVDPTCNGQCNGTATATPVNPVGPVTYAWSTIPVQTGQTATGLCAGNYTVTATDSLGNTDTDLVTISNPAAITVAMSSTTAGCDSLATATATPAGGTAPYSYLWTPSGQTTQTATNLPAPGAYSVLVTDSNGCTATGNVNVTLLLPTITLVMTSTPAGCNNGNGLGTATATPSGGAIPYTYFWSTGDVSQTIINLPAGSYSVTVTDAGGCVATGNVNVTSIPSPVANFSYQTSSICFENNSFNFAAITGSNAATTTYAWTFQNGNPGSSASTTQQVSFIQSGVNQVSLITTFQGCTDTMTTSITIPSRVLVDAGLDVEFCAGEGGTQLFATASNGTSPYYYEWWCDSTNTWCGLDSVFDNDPIANPNVSTMYYVQVTDFNGCTSEIDSAFVTVNPLPLVFAGPDQYICAQPAPGAFLTPSITNSSGPFSFQWTPSLGLNNDTISNPFARPDTTTIYFLQVTDLGTGCMSNANTVDTNSSVTVIVSPLPHADAGPDHDLCNEDTLMLNGIGTQAGPAYDFEWSPATGLSSTTIANPLAFPSATTDYVLTVWSNGCPSIGDTVTIFVHTLPTVNAGPNVEICFGDSVLLDAQAAGDTSSSFYNYQWTPAAGLSNPTVEDPMASPALTGFYLVNGISSWGCESPADSVLVTIKPTPIADAGGPFVICAGQSITLPGSWSYATPDTANVSQLWPTWTPNQNISDVNVFQPVVTPTATQYYYLTIQYNTCSTIDSVLINVMPTPVATLDADTTSACIGDTIHLNSDGGLGGATFTWFPAAGLSDPNVADPLAFPTDTTTYFVIVSEGQCSDTASITLNPLATPQMAIASSPLSGCVPFTVSFLELTSDATLYTWNFGDGTISNEQNPTHLFDEVGQYTISLTGANLGGCKSTLADLIVDVADTAHPAFHSSPNFPAELMLPDATVHFFDDSQNANAWIWSFGDQVESADQNPVHQFTEEGVYYVTLTVQNERECVSKITQGPYVVVTPDIFIPNVFSPNGDNINDTYWVRYTGNQPFTLSLFDRWGNLIFTQNDKYAGWDGTVENEAAPAGVYYYVVKVGSKMYNGNVTLVR
jgi:gliding motility-associated-like protein